MPFGTLTLNDGNEIPAIAFGTGTAFYQRDARDVCVQALENGFVHLDTAQMYKNEASVGKAIKESSLSRSQMYLATKFSGGNIDIEFKASLDKLGVDYVDLYLIHFPKFVPDLESAWKKFEGIKEKGLARSIGVSNFRLDDLKRLINIARIKPAVNQISFHPYNYAQNKELLQYCREHGIVVEAYGTLTPLTKRRGGPVDVPVQRAAERIGATPGQVILLWAMMKGVVIVTTTSSQSRIVECLGAADLPLLTPDEIRAIDAAGARS